MTFIIYSLSYTIGMFIGLLVFLKAGHLMGRQYHPREKETSAGNVLDGVVFALLGLLLAFVFSGSLTSYQTHRDLLTREANDVDEFYMKLDLLPNDFKTNLKSLTRQYATSRLAATQASVYSEEEDLAIKESERLKDAIWSSISDISSATKPEFVALGLIDSFNKMTGNPADQLADERNHVPKIIYLLIFVLSMMAALVAGFGMAEHAKIPIIRIITFSTAVALTIYVIIDLEYPRSGVFNSVRTNVMLQNVIDGMR